MEKEKLAYQRRERRTAAPRLRVGRVPREEGSEKKRESSFEVTRNNSSSGRPVDFTRVSLAKFTLSLRRAKTLC